MNALRWLGPGCLHIKRGPDTVVITPNTSRAIVTEQDLLQALGAARIAELVARRQAQEIDPKIPPESYPLVFPSDPEAEADLLETTRALEAVRRSGGELVPHA